MTDEDRKAFEFWRETYRATSLQEDVFRDLVAAGAIESVGVEIEAGGRAYVTYKLGSGALGVLHTKRGQLKRYRPETALRFLRDVGVVRVTVAMNLWKPSPVETSDAD